MREPHSDGGRGDSSSGAFTYSRQHLSTHSDITSTVISSVPACTPSDTTGFNIRTDGSPCKNSSVSPPPSPSLSSSCSAPKPTQNHPVDLLAVRLRNQSLLPQSCASIPSPPNSAVAPTATFLSRDDVVASRILPDQDDSTAMELDSNDLTAYIVPPQKCQSSRDDQGIMAPTPPSGSSSARQLSSTTPPSTPEDQAQSSDQALHGCQYQLMCGRIEVDEGYCEDDDEFLWMDSITSQNGQKIPESFKKRCGLEYRTSSEAASRCKNAIHSVPRMRRRDKKRRRRLQHDKSALELQQ